MRRGKLALLVLVPLLLFIACEPITELFPAWSATSLPGGPASRLTDIDATSADRVIVVGDDGEAWINDGFGWDNAASGLGIDFTGVALWGSRAWVCGVDGADNGWIYEYDLAGNWTNHDLGSNVAWLAGVDSAENLSAAVGSEGQIWLNQGGGWSLYYEDAAYLWRAVNVSSSGVILVVGVELASGEGCYALFSPPDTPAPVTISTLERLEDGQLTGDDTAWLVDRNGVLAQLDHGVSTQKATLGFIARGLSAIDDATCWVCGMGGSISRYSNGQVKSFATDSSEAFESVILTSAEEGFLAAQTQVFTYR